MGLSCPEARSCLTKGRLVRPSTPPAEIVALKSSCGLGRHSFAKRRRIPRIPRSPLLSLKTKRRYRCELD
jgi:hypothetical protein